MTRFTKIYLFFCLCLIFRASDASKLQLLEHAENCDPNVPKCDSKAGLYCDSDSEHCVCKPFYIYDKKRKHCLPPVGGYCKINDTTEIPCPKHSTCEFLQMYEAVPKSIRRAVLAASGLTQLSTMGYVCTCSFGYAPEAHSCKVVQTFGKSCEKTADCDVGAGLFCSDDGTCACADKKMVYYDKKSHKCLHKLGAVCHGLERCEDGTVCDSELLSYMQIIDNYNRKFNTAQYAAGLKKLQKYGGHCVCNPGTMPNSVGRCVGNFRATCTDDEPCNTDGFLACIDGICQCEIGASALYDSRHGISSCRLTLGSTCDKKGPKCIGNSTCVNGKCEHECEDGLSPTPMGGCLETYGSSCDASDGKFCNNYEGLACIEGTCACFDATVKWDKKRKVCVAKLGGRCGKFKILEAEIPGTTANPFRGSETTEVDHYVLGCAEGQICRVDETGLSEMKFCAEHD